MALAVERKEETPRIRARLVKDRKDPNRCIGIVEEGDLRNVVVIFSNPPPSSMDGREVWLIDYEVRQSVRGTKYVKCFSYVSDETLRWTENVEKISRILPWMNTAKLVSMLETSRGAATAEILARTIYRGGKDRGLLMVAYNAYEFSVRLYLFFRDKPYEIWANSRGEIKVFDYEYGKELKPLYLALAEGGGLSASYISDEYDLVLLKIIAWTITDVENFAERFSNIYRYFFTFCTGDEESVCGAMMIIKKEYSDMLRNMVETAVGNKLLKGEEAAALLSDILRRLGVIDVQGQGF